MNDNHLPFIAHLSIYFDVEIPTHFFTNDTHVPNLIIDCVRTALQGENDIDIHVGQTPPMRDRSPLTGRLIEYVTVIIQIGRRFTDHERNRLYDELENLGRKFFEVGTRTRFLIEGDGTGGNAWP